MRRINPLAEGLLRALFASPEQRKQHLGEAVGDFVGEVLEMAGQTIKNGARQPPEKPE